MTTTSRVIATTAPDPGAAEPGVPVFPAVRVITVLAVVVVAVIAAVVSYSHMQQLAGRAGEGWRSYLIPLSIDGLVVAASMVLLTRRRHGLTGGGLAWSALGGGVLASLAANMADARPEVTAVLVAGWPAVAFAVAFELLLQQRRAEHTSPHPEAAPIPGNQAIPDTYRQETPTWTPTPTSIWSPSLTTTVGTSAPGSPPNNSGSSNTTAGSSRSTAAPADRVSTPIRGPRGAHSHEPLVADPADLTAAALPVSQVVPPVVTTSPPPAPVPGLGAAEPLRVSHPATAQVGDDGLVARVGTLLAGAEADGRRLGRRAVAAELGVTEYQARVAMELLETREGDKRSSIELTATEVGASVQFAQVRIVKPERRGAGAASAPDAGAGHGVEEQQPPV